MITGPLHLLSALWYQIGWYGDTTINSATYLPCHSICKSRPNAAPVHTKIAKDPDAATHPALCFKSARQHYLGHLRLLHFRRFAPSDSAHSGSVGSTARRILLLRALLAGVTSGLCTSCLPFGIISVGMVMQSSAIYLPCHAACQGRRASIASAYEELSARLWLAARYACQRDDWTFAHSVCPVIPSR